MFERYISILDSIPLDALVTPNFKTSKSFLIINHYAGAPKYGPAYRHYDISKELIKQGHKVCIVASSTSHLRNSPNCKKENIDGIDFIWVKCLKYNGYGFKRFINMICSCIFFKFGYFTN